MNFRAHFSGLVVASLFGWVVWAGPQEEPFATEGPVFERRSAIVLAYEKTHKAVANISGQRIVSSSPWPTFDLRDWWFGKDMFTPRYELVLGSGVVIHEDGYIATNAHVVKDTPKLKITFDDGSEYSAELVSADENKDLAVLKITADKKLPFIHLGRSDDLMIGETVIAIGNPFGYSHTLTRGVISALGRDIQVYQGFWLRGLVQTDAPINPGNSGGPLLNINGELIGINTAINPEAQNIGFAIPVDTLADNLIDMLMPEKLRRVRLGLVIGRMKVTAGHSGVVVDAVVKASPAEQEGIKPGDLVVRIDEEPVTSFIDFYVKMISKQVGEPILVEYIRPDEPRPQKRLARLKMEPRPLPDGRKLFQELFQMDVSELNDDIARRFGYSGAYPILVITEVQKGQQAERAGVEAGDLILEVNGQAVSNLRELSLTMEKINEGDTAMLRILRIAHRPGFEIRRQLTVELKATRKETGRYRFL